MLELGLQSYFYKSYNHCTAFSYHRYKEVHLGLGVDSCCEGSANVQEGKAMSWAWVVNIKSLLVVKLVVIMPS